MTDEPDHRWVDDWLPHSHLKLELLDEDFLLWVADHATPEDRAKYGPLVKVRTSVVPVSHRGCPGDIGWHWLIAGV